MSSIEVIADYSAPDDLLEDRVILVTGANRGIGRAVARLAAAHGATVILSGRDIAGLERLHDEIRDAGGATPTLLPLDLLKATVDDYRAAATAVEDAFGRLDGFAHIAGVLGELSPIAHYPPMTWHNVMHVNLSAAFLLTQALLPLLTRTSKSSVIFSSSSVGREGRAHWGAYAVSKFATEGLMQTLADEHSGQPRVNSLNPGATRTDMRRAAFPAEDASRLCTADEVATAYLYLLGKDGEGANGGTFNAQPG